jgi:hypothetical protein
MKKSELKQIIREEIKTVLKEASSNSEIKVGYRFNDDGRKVTIIALDPKRNEVEVEDIKGMTYSGDAETFGFKFKSGKLYK